MIPVKEQTPHVPISPNEIIEQVHEAYELGITIVHLHARDDEGKPTYKANVYVKIMEGIRQHCPDLVLCVSLSGRNFPEVEKRAEPLQLKPDMASLTLSSLNFPKSASVNSPETILALLNRMKENGVNPELECFDSGMVNYSKYLIKKGLVQAPFYYNLLFGNVFNCQADLAYAGLMVKDLPENSYWSFAGIGNTQLPTNAWAISYGGGVRVGI
ncbi:MAG: 3-keto-5-aminohexanoate cleavage protein, partial [Bacteroidetes bacterium]|nr:3-keto-5-aminohexanoate cleavage protein [Bacteroidota bacterium]